MNRIFTAWMMPCLAMRFTSTIRHSMDELAVGAGHWSDRLTRQKMHALAPGYDEDSPGFDTLGEPELPTPTDVPVPEPNDVPVPEPIDVPPPEPKQPEFDPKPRSVP